MPSWTLDSFIRTISQSSDTLHNTQYVISLPCSEIVYMIESTNVFMTLALSFTYIIFDLALDAGFKAITCGIFMYVDVAT